jgi:hypothetical protein
VREPSIITEVKPYWIAVAQVHADRDVGVDFDEGVDQSGQHDVVGVGAGASASLDDHRRVELVRPLHYREALLHIVDIERRQGVVMLGRVIQKLP